MPLAKQGRQRSVLPVIPIKLPNSLADLHPDAARTNFLLESILVLAFILIKIANRNKKVRVGHHQRVIHISIVAGAINDLSVAERRGSPCLGQDVLLSSIYSKQCA